MNIPLDRRPVLVALAGPNGAGKTTFYEAHLRAAGLRYLGADDIARSLELDAYTAARVAGELRVQLVKLRESFVFETVFSDPVGDKLTFLKDAVAHGYNVVLCFIGTSGWQVSEARVAMRVTQGGHDVPTGKIKTRFPRTLANLAKAIRELPQVRVYDNDDLRTPFRLVAIFENGVAQAIHKPIPRWLKSILLEISSPKPSRR